MEKRKTRQRVGRLERAKDGYSFTYEERYLRSRNTIPLGPEFPMTKRSFHSKRLFASLDDRIPSRENSAYPEYCALFGISPKESDALILLSTIGKRGPSSFVFEPVYERSFGIEDVIQFREALSLSTREFAQIFELSQSSLNLLERRHRSGKDILKRLEIVIRFPEVAAYYFKIHGGLLSPEKWKKASDYLQLRLTQKGEKG